LTNPLGINNKIYKFRGKKESKVHILVLDSNDYIII